MNDAIERQAQGVEITPEQIELIKRTVAAGATNDELKLYLFDCKRIGIHPLDKLLHFTVRTDKRGNRKYTPIVSIDMFRIRAAETGEFLGCTKPVWTGKPGTKGSSVELCAKRLVKGVVAEHWGIAHWDEFCPPPGQDHMWLKMPNVMLPKCAEAQAIRRGFPKELHGLYVHEEMAQAGQTVNGQDDTYAKAMVQDFPPNIAIDGLLMAIHPPEGDDPATLTIQIPGVGAMKWHVFGDEQKYQPLVGHEVVFVWGKKGSIKHVKEMYLKPAPKAVEAQAPLKGEPDPFIKEFNEKHHGKTPPEQEPQHQRGLVERVTSKTGKKGEYSILKIEEPNGENRDWFCFKTPSSMGLELFEELEGQGIFFESKTEEKNGKLFYHITDLWPEDIYEQAMAERANQEAQA